MKFYNGTNYSRTYDDKQALADNITFKATATTPYPPRDLLFQPGSRGGLLTWKLPTNDTGIIGYRIYKGDDLTLYEEIRDRGRRQEYLELSAAPVSPNAISAIARASNIVTVTAPNNYRMGGSVVITGVTDTSFNGTFTVSTATAISFTYAQTGANASSSAGNATAPPVTAVWVTCINIGGISFESQKVQILCQSIAEAVAPSVPAVPPGYTGESGGGGDTGQTGGGGREQRFSL